MTGITKTEMVGSGQREFYQHYAQLPVTTLAGRRPYGLLVLS
jgi:hypothetical protein